MTSFEKNKLALFKVVFIFCFNSSILYVFKISSDFLELLLFVFSLSVIFLICSLETHNSFIFKLFLTLLISVLLFISLNSKLLLFSSFSSSLSSIFSCIFIFSFVSVSLFIFFNFELTSNC